MTRTITTPFLTAIEAAARNGLTREQAHTWGVPLPLRRDWVAQLCARSRRAYPDQPEPPIGFEQHNAHCRAENFPTVPKLAVLQAMPAVTARDLRRWGFLGKRQPRDSWRKVAMALSRERYGNWEAQHGPRDGSP